MPKIGQGVKVGCFIAACGLLCAIALAVYVGKDKEVAVDIGEHSYHFQSISPMNLETILGSFKQSAYIPHGSLLESKNPPVSWSQKQFFDLMTATISNEMKLGAKVEDIDFAVSCTDISFGPQIMAISFYRLGVYQDRDMRLETSVFADARTGYLDQIFVGYYPPTAKIIVDAGLDAKIPAEKILPLAEQAGGQEFRESQKNNCIARGNLIGGSWDVTYVPTLKQAEFYAVTLDAFTGKVKEVRSPTVLATPR